MTCSSRGSRPARTGTWTAVRKTLWRRSGVAGAGRPDPAQLRALHRPERLGVGSVESRVCAEPAHGPDAARWAADSAWEPAGGSAVGHLGGNDAPDILPLLRHPLRRGRDAGFGAAGYARLQRHNRDAAAGGAATARVAEVPDPPGVGPLAGPGAARRRASHRRPSTRCRASAAATSDPRSAEGRRCAQQGVSTTNCWRKPAS